MTDNNKSLIKDIETTCLDGLVTNTFPTESMECVHKQSRQVIFQVRFMRH